MKKLLSWLGWVDTNLVHIAFIFFIAAISLLPKLPVQYVEYTYIRIRLDDVLPFFVTGIFLIQWARRKINLNRALLIPIFLFWMAVFISFYWGYNVIGTIPWPKLNVGLLHALRRIQYMMVFFVAASVIISEKRFFTYLRVYFVTLFLVSAYALAQKFLGFCSFQSMNPAYADGRCLILNAADRINSTFGGHFDLAAYITFSIPIVIGYYFYTNKKRYVLLFALILMILFYTAARSSFGAYVASVTLFLLILRKFKFLLFTVVLSVILLLITGDMTDRLMQTFQVKTVFVNTNTGLQKIDQKITLDELPAGNSVIPFLGTVKSQPPESAVEAKIRVFAMEQVIADAEKKGVKLSDEEVNKLSAEMAKFVKPQQLLFCDISCSTRLQVEWPRAILAFKNSPVVGTGPSSITEATDNDLLRWLGEFGLLGTSLFLFILAAVCRKVYKLAKRSENAVRPVYYGFIFGTAALIINGIYIDVFEASKVAYNFWTVSGMFVGMATLYVKKSKKN